MAWLTRIKNSLLSKIRKKIPKKDLQSVEKARQDCSEGLASVGRGLLMRRREGTAAGYRERDQDSVLHS